MSRSSHGRRAGPRRLKRFPERLRSSLARTGLHFHDGNHVRFFEDGHSGLEAMLEAIIAARSFVHLETYILRDDRTGMRFLEALEERAASGVAVRVLYDGFGAIALDESALAGLRGAGGQVVEFHPLFRIYPNWAPRRRDHRKILVVDGAVAFTGGLNIGDEYDAAALAGATDAGWRDTHVELHGPIVRDLSAVFLESWFRADGPDLPWHLVLDPDASEVAVGETRAAILADGPVYVRHEMRDLLVGALDQAKHTASLTSPYFAPGPRLLDALVRAAARGVRVRLLLAGATDHPLLRLAAHTLLPRLQAAGVQVHEYTGGVMHTKSAVFDDEFATVGTSNLDRQSFLHSYEVNVLFDDPPVARQLARLFERDLANSVPLVHDPTRRRGLVARLADALLSLLLRII